jgi:hypothetical protein
MLKMIRQRVYPLLLFTRWNAVTRNISPTRGEFVWKRYNWETDTWETKEMSPEEREDAYWWWAVK